MYDALGDALNVIGPAALSGPLASVLDKDVRPFYSTCRSSDDDTRHRFGRADHRATAENASAGHGYLKAPRATFRLRLSPDAISVSVTPLVTPVELRKRWSPGSKS